MLLFSLSTCVKVNSMNGNRLSLRTVAVKLHSLHKNKFLYNIFNIYNIAYLIFKPRNLSESTKGRKYR